MEKKVKKRGNFIFEWGVKGLRMSLYILLILLCFLLIYSFGTYPLNELISIILRIPKTNIDFLAILEGVILFIMIPFLVGIMIGLRSKKGR